LVYVANEDSSKPETMCLWEWRICDLSEVDEFLDEQGSLILDLQANFHFIVQEKNQSTGRQDNISMRSNLRDHFCKDALKGLASLLGDECTSDISIFVVDGEETVGSFACHTKILAGIINISNNP